MYRVILPAAAYLAAGMFLSTPAYAVEVYLFKGAGDFSFVSEGLHFSRGLERIANTLNDEGIHAEVRGFAGVEDAMYTIRKRKPESVAFIGHSMGALASLSMARRMRSEGIRVAYVGLIDIPGPVGTAGSNVERVENYYSIYPVYGRLTNVKSHPNAKNIHVSGQIHTTMDDSRKVRNGMLAALRQIHSVEQRMMPGTKPGPAVAPQVETQHVSLPPIEPEQLQQQPVQTALPPIEPEQLQVQPARQPQYVQPAQTATYSAVVEPDLLPMVLPSVDPQYQPQIETAIVPTQPVAEIASPSVDRTRTAAIGRRVVDTGRNLLQRAAGFVGGLSSARSTSRPAVRENTGR